MTIYVLEGPDLAGKTTLADEIEKHHRGLGHAVFRRKVNQPAVQSQFNLFRTYFDLISFAAQIDAHDSAVIIDRLHVGEWIYGPIKRANSLLSWAQIEALDNLLDSIEAKKIFVDIDYYEMMDRYGSRGETFVTAKELNDIATEYRNVLYRRDDTRIPDLHGWTRVFMVGQEVPAVWDDASKMVERA